jgi:signal transduction histidine kinase
MKGLANYRKGSLQALARRFVRPASMFAAATMRSRLFLKYVSLFVAVVSLALVVNGLFEVWFTYQEQKTSLIQIQHGQAVAAASKIEQFLVQIESQIGWTTQLPWSASLEQRRFDALRLLRQVPAITELAEVDPSGHEQLRVSRLAMDVVGNNIDVSKEPAFVQAMAHRVYYGPVYFRRQSEPYITLSLAGAGPAKGVSVAQVNLKFIWDVVSNIKVGKHGLAYVVDGDGRLIAHPDISLVLRKTDMLRLPQVRSARGASADDATEEIHEAENLQGQRVLTAYAPVPKLRWLVFVETPVGEALAPLYASFTRTGYVLLGALALSVIAGSFLAGKMVVPIQALRAGAARIGSGDLTQRIQIKTGDEVETLADQFNHMAGRLQESYAELERKVEDRTEELSESLQQQTAMAELLRVISSSRGDLAPVFEAMLEKATHICNAKFGILFLSENDSLRVAALYGVSSIFAELGKQSPLIHSNPGTTFGRLATSKQPIQIADISAETLHANDPEWLSLLRHVNARAMISVPMLEEDMLVGQIAIFRDEVLPFAKKQIELVQNFAAQAVIAIENTRLLSELRHRTEELARSVEGLRALGEVSQAVNSTLDLETVLSTIVTKAVQLSGTDAGAIYGYDETAQEFRLRATYGMTPELIDALTHARIGIDEPNVASALAELEPIQVEDLRNEGASEVNEITLKAGYRARLVAPLIRGDDLIGLLVVRRRTPGAFTKRTIDLLKTFAGQSVLAIQNARLFHEVEDKGRELEIASQHKSQFLANMSHELRTPLNAILGYSELILDNIYGDAPEKMRVVLERVQSNGKHLLSLINDVLDLSKIEAGQLKLSLDDFSITDMVHSAYAAVEPLARSKQLAFRLDVQPDLPAARGDHRRLTQVLLNLVGNAIKFTDRGEVLIKTSAGNGTYTVVVRDSGPGIPLSDQQRIFEEFQQADSSQTKAKGGTGLGLSIARRIVEMHGGRLWVESSPGRGATFSFTMPLRVEQQA